jgi:hypothetical protein
VQLGRSIANAVRFAPIVLQQIELRSRRIVQCHNFSLNGDTIRQIDKSFDYVRVSEHGELGVEVLRKLLLFIKEVYTYVDPETCPGALVIFKSLDDSQEVIARSDATEVQSVKDLAQYISGDCVIEALNSGRALVWHKPPDLKKIAKQAVVYTYKQRIEFFHAGAKSAEVEKVVVGCASSFAIPTFDELKDALQGYRSDMIRHSSCPMFKKVWFDNDRLFFRTKQEKTMRDSLSYYLKARLRGVEVRPEQIVSSSHPVDIKVTWFLSNRLADLSAQLVAR